MPSSIGHAIYPTATEPTRPWSGLAVQARPTRSLSCITHHVTSQTNLLNAGALGWWVTAPAGRGNGGAEVIAAPNPNKLSPSDLATSLEQHRTCQRGRSSGDGCAAFERASAVFTRPGPGRDRDPADPGHGLRRVDASRRPLRGPTPPQGSGRPGSSPAADLSAPSTLLTRRCRGLARFCGVSGPLGAQRRMTRNRASNSPADDTLIWLLPLVRDLGRRWSAGRWGRDSLQAEGRGFESRQLHRIPLFALVRRMPMA